MPKPARPPLDDSQMAGQLLFIGIDGTSLSGELARRLRSICPGGIILFARNLVDGEQVAAFCRELDTHLPVRPFLAIDQEGGRVNRLKGIFPEIPPNLRLAAREDAEDRVRAHGRETGRGLRLLGFNLNFAPVLDLSSAESPNGIGDRAYGSEPPRVADLARVFLEAQRAEGVLGCGKHFPGLGEGRVDSHLELPVIVKSSAALFSADLVPYRVLRDRLPMIMVGHAFYPDLQGPAPRPATLSEQVVQQLLRERIGYLGVILTDDLEMGAVDQQTDPGEVAWQALQAGNDMMMYCKSWERIEAAHHFLHRRIRSGSLSTRRLNSSLERLFDLKDALASSGGLPPFRSTALQEVCQGLGRLEAAEA